MMKKYYQEILISIFLLSTSLLQPVAYCQQVHNNSKLQYGISFDIRWEIVYKYGYLSNFRVGVSGGIAPVISGWFMPFSQLSLVTFQGGVGSSISVKERNKLNLESLLSFGVVAGSQKGPDVNHKRGIHTIGLYNPAPLLNPFNTFLGLSSTFIHRFTKFAKANHLGKFTYSQKVGAVSLGTKNWDFNYYNDGTPFDFLGLGDGKDRYYTGGGFFRHHISNKFESTSRHGAFRNIVVGFDRFTGHYPESFEVAHNLGLANVPYGDKSQAFFNKGRTFIGLELASVPGLIPTFSINDNDAVDIQYLIHRARKQPLHRTLHKESYGFNLYYNRNIWDMGKNLSK
jgi:hypothetical protein